jgi:hypothetical protein
LLSKKKCTYPNVYQYYPKTPQKRKIVFWPDLTSAQYAKDTLVRLEELKIEYVPIKENPPNVPQLRQIENF